MFFFLLTAACSLSGFILKILIAKQQWEINPRADIPLILNGAWYTLKSVLFEELIFRGVLLYILIHKAGAVKAVLISAIAFGIYHWFSQQLWGNPVQMVIIFIITGSMGIILAYAYVKTFSLFIPVAIHLGWNLIQMVVFSGNTIGNQFFVLVSPSPEISISLFGFMLVTLFPIISCLVLNGWLLQRKPQVSGSLKNA
jgi:membrane protease YdiL (CAAX protease family)